MKISARKSRWVLLFCALGYAAFSFYFLDKYPTVYLDEAEHNEPSVNFLKTGHFGTNILPPVGGFEKSSLIRGRIHSFSQAVIFKIFGVNVRAMRLQSYLAGLLTLLLTYLIAVELFASPAVGVISAFLLATSHLFFFAHHFGRADMTVALFATGAIYVFLQAQKRDSRILYVLSGLVSALAVDVHAPGSMAMFSLAGLGALAFFRKKLSFTNGLLMALGVALGIFWWAFFHILLDPKFYAEQYKWISGPFQQRAIGRNPLSQISDETLRWYKYFWTSAYHRNMFIALLLGLAAIYGVIKKNSGYFALLAMIAGGYLGYAYGAPNKAPWYIIYLYPILMILIGAAFWDAFQSRSILLKGASVALFAALLGFVGLEFRERFKFTGSDYNAFIARIKEHVPPGKRVLTSDNYWFGLKDYSSLLSSHIVGQRHNFIVQGYRPDYYAGSFEDFLKREKVEYIVADPELTDWPQTINNLNDFLRDHCDLVAEISDPFYGSSNFLSKKSPQPLVTKIYKVIK